VRWPRAAIAAIAVTAVATAPVVAETPIDAPPGLAVRVGQADQFSRIEFRWGGGDPGMGVKRDGQVLRVSFSRDAKPDLSTLKSVPLKWVKSVDVQHTKGGLIFVITLTDDGDAQTGQADGADFVNVFAKETAQAAMPAQTPSPSRPDPVPFNGVVTMRPAMDGAQLRLDFDWRNPCGAAVFRRGDAIWIVFDAAAKLDLSQAPKNAVQFASMQAFAGQGYSAVRIATRPPVALA